jgi:hypothetical protein
VLGFGLLLRRGKCKFQPTLILQLPLLNQQQLHI